MILDESLEVQVNGEQRRVGRGITIADMLAELGLNSARVAVERNLEIVPRSNLSELHVENGDVYEVVHFVGGG